MTEYIARYEQYVEAARLALGRGDRLEAEQSLLAAIASIEGQEATHLQLASALVRLGELKQDDGRLVEAEASFRRALDVAERARGTEDMAVVPALSALGRILMARNANDEAEPVLTRALALAERHLGREHPDLVGLLNALSRLYFRRPAPALAEPLLMRLHDIKRAKGEDHPEVATVLASLAAVRQALGRHDAAEQLLRRVVEIRERTLAPNHFAIATALEHLAQTCAARGRIDEALQLCYRALAMRELTLGVEHPSVRVARERIADLQLQEAEDPIGADPLFGVAPAPAPRVSTPPMRAPGPPIPPIAPPPPVATRTATPPSAYTPLPTMTQAAPVATTSLAPTMSAAASPSDWRVPATPELLASIVAREPDREVALAPADRARADDLEAELAEGDTSSSAIRFVTVSQPGKATATVVLPSFDGGAATADDLMLDDENAPRPTGLAALAALVRRRRTTVIATGAAGAALLLLAMTTGFARSSDEQPMVRAFEPDAQLRVPEPAATTATRSVTSSAGTTDSVAHVAAPAATREALAESRSSRERAAARSEERESKPEAESPAKAAAMPSLGALPSAPDLARAVQNAVSVRADSVLRAGGSSTVARLSVLDAPRRSGVAATVPPQLIGSIPTPKFPAALREKRFDGMVVVEFMVDTTGAPITSTINVVQSNHAAFTEAVRAVVPRMRFVPAQSDGRPTTGRVRVPFEFAL